MKQNLTQEQVPDFVADVRRWYEKGLGVDFCFDQALWDASAVDPSSLEDDRILDALDRLFASSGIRGVTMERLSRETGMAQSSFYYRFKNKEELVSETGKRSWRVSLPFSTGGWPSQKTKSMRCTSSSGRLRRTILPDRGSPGCLPSWRFPAYFSLPMCFLPFPISAHGSVPFPK